ncbi:DUF1353 domain-containing protein [Hymenobacter taeanensis]|uniref:DUF1353 domain-containing protein n=1 Tax=Hymenobacter taeanensis TaxID=2735321 RepID=A0A6M6BGG5_9BACT|nr:MULTISPECIES: DUF1353 domain-containing protein [Hymenobacter]QJX47317.1 DUF1353 domain-containing protein [Hymenobacter taeanensis]UOQ79346.1 DUF1353 domain-containing protein [Hymenobacter sp. 5414T-23]
MPVPTRPNDPHEISTADFVFTDCNDRKWTAPNRTITDGASIPSAFLSLIGDRYDDRWRGAALVHDAYCGAGNSGGTSFHRAPWRSVHRMFYAACLAGKTPRRKALLMYAAVYWGGPRWNVVPSDTVPLVFANRKRTDLTSDDRLAARLDLSNVSQLLRDRQFVEVADFIMASGRRGVSLDALEALLQSAADSVHVGKVLPLRAGSITPKVAREMKKAGRGDLLNSTNDNRVNSGGY